MLHEARGVGINDCAIAASVAVTGLHPKAFLAMCRLHDPTCVGPRRGVPVRVYLQALAEFDIVFAEEGKRDLPCTSIQPLHLFLARLKGRRAIIVLHYPGTRRGDTHAVAAEDFMLCDNMHPRPQWYGSYLEECGFKSMPRVLHATIIEEGSKS